MTSNPPQQLEALNHVVRRRILRSFEDGGRRLGLAEISEAVGSPPSRVSHHIGLLVEAGVLAPDTAEGARGASRWLYRLEPDGRVEWVRAALDAYRDRDDGHRA